MASAPRDWWLYVLVSEVNARTYVGITTTLADRLAAHNGARRGGARATRAHRPWRFGAVHGPYPDRASASRAEWALKRGRRGLARLRWHAPDDPRWRPACLDHALRLPSPHD